MIPFCKYKARRRDLNTKHMAILSSLREYCFVGTLRGRSAFTNGRWLLLGTPKKRVPTKPYAEAAKKYGGRFDHLEPKGKQIEIFPLAFKASENVNTIVKEVIYLGEANTEKPVYGREVNALFFDGVKTAVPDARFFVLRKTLSGEEDSKEWIIMVKNKRRKLVGFLMPLRSWNVPAPEVIKANSNGKS